jgi:cell division protein FtsB
VILAVPAIVSTISAGVPLLQQNQLQAEQIQQYTQENEKLRERIARLEKNASNLTGVIK